MDYLIRFTFLFLTLCSFPFYAFSNQLDRVAVIVNDGVVLESDIQLKVREYKKNAALEGQSIPGDEALRETVVEQLILDELQLQIADRVGIINNGELLLIEEKKELLSKMGSKMLIIELSSKIKKIPKSLSSYQLQLSNNGNELAYTYKSNDERTGITSLLMDIKKAGIKLSDLSTSQTSLEEIFVDMVKK